MSVNKILTIIQEVLDIEDGSIEMSSTPNDIHAWDSVGTINIILALESEFSIKFKLEDLQNINKIQDFVDLYNTCTQ